jgi:hypothetical protein
VRVRLRRLVRGLDQTGCPKKAASGEKYHREEESQRAGLKRDNGDALAIHTTSFGLAANHGTDSSSSSRKYGLGPALTGVLESSIKPYHPLVSRRMIQLNQPVLLTGNGDRPGASGPCSPGERG